MALERGLTRPHVMWKERPFTAASEVTWKSGASAPRQDAE